MGLRTIARCILGAFLLVAGISHLTWSRTDFQAQVPSWVPLNVGFVVIASGVVEIILGAALILLPQYRLLTGWIVAAFFVAVFPGNISQLVTGTDAFGLKTDAARTIRLFFQPLLVAWALWSTEAWRDRKTITAMLKR
ncbi:membrane protein [soil metagenome]